MKQEWRSQFCQDFKIPIKIYASPIFEYLISLYEKDLDISKKMNMFHSTMDSCGNDIKAFKDLWHKTKNLMINEISATPEYQKLMAEKWDYQTPFKVERGNPYNHAFTNVECISLDLISANYNSLRYVDPKIVLNTNSFKDLVLKYSSDPYFQEVKIFRQIVFESLGANRQQAIQRKMMDEVLKSLFDLKKDLYLRMPSNDEIVIPLYKDQKDLGEKIKELVKKHDLSEYLKLEQFTVRHIEDDMFYKELSTGKKILRNVPAHFYPRCFKKVHDLPIQDEDLYFIFEGKLAKFIGEKNA